MKDYILIFGAKGDIARELARLYAVNGNNLILSGRNIEELNDFKSDLQGLNAKIMLKELDITDFESFPKYIKSLPSNPKGFIFITGSNPANASENINVCVNTIHVNYTGPVLMINQILNHFQDFKNGFIIGVSSVAGERGRQKNYIYGSAKASFTTYLSGMRQRLRNEDIHVMTVHPGFVRTKMTASIPMIKFLTAEPYQAALDIYAGQQKRKEITYTRWYWSIIMLIVRNIPEFIFKKTNL